MEKLSVVLVDDEPDISKFMKAMLTKKAPNFEITVLDKARECLDLIKSKRVDCILCDYQMPGLNGMELLESIRDEGYDTPFIFVTGQGNEEVAREAFKEGANDYFTKDIGFAHFARIINSIEQAVRQYNSRKEKESAEKSALRYAHKLETLSKASMLMNSVLDTDEVMRRLVSSAMTLVDGASGAAGRVIDGSMVFREYNQDGELVPIDYSFAPGYGVPGHVMQTKTPYLTKDAEHDPHVSPEIRQALQFHTLIDVPILTRGGELLGCFEIHNKAGGAEFDERDKGLLEGLASSAAVALENAILMQKLAGASREWEETFDAMDDLVTVHDPDFTVTRVNRAACDALGLDTGDIIGRKFFDLFPQSPLTVRKEGDNTSSVSSITGEFAAKGRVSLMRHEVALDGRLFEASVYPMKVDGELAGFVNVAKDITDRKKRETSVLKSKEMLSAVLDSIQMGIIVVGMDRRILKANKAALGIMGLDKDDGIVGSICHKHICPADEGSCPVIDLGQTVDLSEKTLLGKDGKPIPILKSVSRVMFGDEQVLLETFIDMRGKKEAGQEAA